MRNFQYAMSDSPEVLAAVQGNADLYHDFVEKATAWAESLGLTQNDVRVGRWHGAHVSRLARNPVGHGRWTKDGRPHARLNRDELARMKALTYDDLPIPGLPGMFTAPAPDFQSWWMTPRPFLSGGKAWVILPHHPYEGSFGEQWVEVKASEAYAALESRKEAHAANDLEPSA